MTIPKTHQKEPTTSLLDSVFYQSALRVNRLEDNKLRKIQSRIHDDYQSQHNRHSLVSKSAYEWAMDMRKTSGRTYSTNPARMRNLPIRPKTVPDAAPTCCVLYGMVMGERPVLLKNFLGRKTKKKKAESPDENHLTDSRHQHSNANEKSSTLSQHTNLRISTSQRTSRPKSKKPVIYDSPRSSTTGEIYKSFMYDNKLVTQVPIGYSRTSIRPHTSFVSHTSEMLRPENAKIPNYYSLRYKYILPPISMFR